MSFNEAYLARLREGDQDTAKHFNMYFRRMLNVILAGKFQRERVEELLDRIMLAVVSNVMKGEPRDPARLAGYVKGVCANLTRREIQNLPREAASDVNLDRFSGAESTPEDKVLAKERAARVREVLREMSERDRDVLVDLFYYEIPREKVCQKHKVQGDQLRMILFHARQRFRKKWTGWRGL